MLAIRGRTATLGMVFLGPPSDPYMVLTSPSANTRPGSNSLKRPGTVSFGSSDPGDEHTVGREDVP
jgi:hypothetical protein